MIQGPRAPSLRKRSACVALLLLSALGCSQSAAPGNSGALGGAGGSAGSVNSSAGTAGEFAAAGAGAGGEANADTGGDGGAGAGGTAGGSGASGVVTAAVMATAMGLGTNIGNTFDNTTAWETGWGQPLVTQTYINGMAAHGIKTVRVPVAWDTYSVGGMIDAAKLNRVKEVVGWIEAAGMYSILNIHWDGGWIDNENNANKYKLTDDVKSKFAAYWKQIGIAFANVGPQLILEGLNEEGRFYVDGDESKGPDYAALNQLNQLFVTTVREQGGYNTSRALLVAGFNTDIDKTCVDAFSIPTDPAGPGMLFLSLHYYNPSTFTILDEVASWGSPATSWGTDAEEAALKSAFDKASAFGKQKQIAIIIGEFGVTRGKKFVRDPAARTLWMQSVASAARARGMVPVLWDTGSEIKRSDGSFSPELQSAMGNLN